MTFPGRHYSLRIKSLRTGIATAILLVACVLVVAPPPRLAAQPTGEPILNEEPFEVPSRQTCDSLERLAAERLAMSTTTLGDATGEANFQTHLEVAMRIAEVPFPTNPQERQLIITCVSRNITRLLREVSAATGVEEIDPEALALISIRLRHWSPLPDMIGAIEFPTDIYASAISQVLRSYRFNIPREDWINLLQLTEGSPHFAAVLRYRGEVLGLEDPLEKAETLYYELPGDEQEVKDLCAQLIMGDLPMGGFPERWLKRNTRAIQLGLLLGTSNWDNVRSGVYQQLNIQEGPSPELVRDLAVILESPAPDIEGMPRAEVNRVRAFGAYLSYIQNRIETPEHPFYRTYADFIRALDGSLIPEFTNLEPIRELLDETEPQ